MFLVMLLIALRAVYGAAIGGIVKGIMITILKFKLFDLPKDRPQSFVNHELSVERLLWWFLILSQTLCGKQLPKGIYKAFILCVQFW